MDANLFNAILAMDSYNRGYGQGIILPTILGITKIGNATISQQSDIRSDSLEVLSNFYAISYDVGAGKIISYRGTDDLFIDPITGWLGAIALPTPQSKFAFDFFRAIIGENADPYTAIVSFTGHSLGGGLAGLVAGVTGHSAVIFDNMPFEAMATFAVNSADLFGAYLPNPNFDYIGAYATMGEVLTDSRFLQSTPVTPLDSRDSGRNWIDLHSMSLLVNLLYAYNEEKALRPGFVDSTGKAYWKNIGSPFINSLFDNNIGLAAGAQSISGAMNDAGDFAGILRTAIAYSAIDGATDGTTVFGDTAIRAMFDDATNLGKILGFTNKSSSLDDYVVSAISDILVQFAGQLAIGNMMKSGDDDPLLKGILALSADQNTLKIDLDPLLWSIGTDNGQPVGNIAGKQDLIAYLTAEDITKDSDGNITGFTPSEKLFTGMKLLWNDVDGNNIDSITYATHNAETQTIADRAAPSSNVGLFITGGDYVPSLDSKGLPFYDVGGGYLYSFTDGVVFAGKNTITGSANNDFIMGGRSIDEFRGGAGDDLLAGGDGPDRLSGGAGHDFLAGGEGIDTVFYEGSSPVTLNITAIPADEEAGLAATIEFDAGGDDVDHVMDMEKIEMGSGNDEIILNQDASNPLPVNFRFDGGAGSDTLTFNGDVGITASIRDDTEGANFPSATTDVMISNIEKIHGTAHNDALNFIIPEDQHNIKEIDTGAGNDVVAISNSSDNYGMVVKLGADDDTLKSTPYQSTVYGGAGKDLFYLAASNFEYGTYYTIKDPDADDRLVLPYNTTTNYEVAFKVMPSVFSPIWSLYIPELPDFSMSMNMADDVLTLSYGDGVGIKVENFRSGDFGINLGKPISGGVRNPIIKGTASADILTGDDGNDAIYGYGGDDVINGGGGDDTLNGGDGGDIIHGGDGNDVIFSSSNYDYGYNVLYGDTGDDTFYSGVSKTTMIGGAGADTFYGTLILYNNLALEVATVSYDTSPGAVNINLETNVNSGGDAEGDLIYNAYAIIGSEYDDKITGNFISNVIDGGIGNDIIDGAGGDDLLTGGDGNDMLVGGFGSDQLTGGAGADTFIIQKSMDIISASNVTITDFNIAEDHIALRGFGGAVDFSSLDIKPTQDGAVITFNNYQKVTLQNIYAPDFTAANFDGSGSGTGGEGEAIGGTQGDDLIGATFGPDIIDASGGNDTVSYAASNAAVNVDLSSSSAQSGGYADGDVLSHIENIVGSYFNDMLAGTSSANNINGNAGSDTVSYTGSSAGVNVNLMLAMQFGGDAEGDILTNIENILASPFNDVLTGNILANNIDGGAGSDTVSYAASASGVNVDLGRATAQSGGDAEGDILANIENIIGSKFDDMLAGNSSANNIDGGDGIDTISYVNAPSLVYVRLDDGYASGGNALGDRFSNIENVMGSGYNDSLYGSTDNNVIHGGAGNDLIKANDGDDTLYGDDGNDSIYGQAGDDIIFGGNGDDTIDGGVGNDIINGGAGVDTIYGLDGDDTLYGDDGNDIIYGGTGTNILVGGTGADVLNGFSGISTASYTASASAVNINLAANINSGGDAEGDLFYGINNITGSIYNDILTGNLNANIIDGGYGNDTIYGGAGNDTLSGGADSDIIYGGAGNDIIYGYNGPGVNGYDTLYGDDGNDIIYCDKNLTTMVGGAGADILNGQYISDGYNSLIGTAIVSYLTSSAAVDINLETNVNSGGDAAGDLIYGVNDVIGSLYDDIITGDSYANFIEGDAGNDILNGGAGDDVLTGDNWDYIYNSSTGSYDIVVIDGAGADIFVIDKDPGSSDIITDFSVGTEGEYINLQGFAEPVDFAHLNISQSGNDTVINLEDSQTLILQDVLASSLTAASFGGIGSAVITGTSGNDVLNGTTGDDIINGLAGNDTINGDDGNDIIDGGAGGDTIDGGNGIDTVSYASFTAPVLINLGTLNQSWGASGDVISNVENIIGSDFGDNLSAASSGSSISGGAGNDTINGRAGNDTLYGGLGNDTLYGGDGDDILYGDDGDDALYGQGGSNILIGGGGADTLNGFTGTSTASYSTSQAGVNVNLALSSAQSGGDAQGDKLAGINNVIGSAFDDTFTGSGSNNILTGGGGNDTYIFNSGFGQDTISNLSPASTAANGKLSFGPGISSVKLWFQKVGSDLEVDLLGSSNKITISGWYGANASAQVASFNTSDGLKVDGQITQLVSAMASYGASNPGFNPNTASQMPTDAILQAAIAAAWHG